MTETKAKHTRTQKCPPFGEECMIHHVYHYQCADCGVDCTAGTPNGPATQQTDGITRCYKCNLTATNKQMRELERLRALNAEMLEALENFVSIARDVGLPPRRELVDAYNVILAAIRKAKQGA